jgi:hypothetical protein
MIELHEFENLRWLVPVGWFWFMKRCRRIIEGHEFENSRQCQEEWLKGTSLKTRASCFENLRQLGQPHGFENLRWLASFLGAFLLPTRGFGLAAATGPTALSFLQVPLYNLHLNKNKLF